MLAAQIEPRGRARWIVAPEAQHVPVRLGGTTAETAIIILVQSPASFPEVFWREPPGSLANWVQSFSTERIDNAPVTPHVLRANSLDVFGERFNVEREDGAIALVHPTWSLMGVGDTPSEALQALLHDASELAREMSDDDPESLSESARALRVYVTRIA